MVVKVGTVRSGQAHMRQARGRNRQAPLGAHFRSSGAAASTLYGVQSCLQCCGERFVRAPDLSPLKEKESHSQIERIYGTVLHLCRRRQPPIRTYFHHSYPTEALLSVHCSAFYTKEKYGIPP